MEKMLSKLITSIYDPRETFYYEIRCLSRKMFLERVRYIPQIDNKLELI